MRDHAYLHNLLIRKITKDINITRPDVGSISGNEPALLPRSSRGGTKTELERAAEIEPRPDVALMYVQWMK